MSNLSENYHLRECFLKRDQVPTQSLIKKTMSPALADVYFKSMNPKLKQLAGLEPSLKGGGSDWYVPPQELLNGRAVLKPVKKQVLSKLNHLGVEMFGEKVFKQRHKALEWERDKVVALSNTKWRDAINAACKEESKRIAGIFKKKNNECIVKDFEYFSTLYRASMEKIESLLQEASIEVINDTREKALLEMREKYEISLKYQATTLYDEFEKKLMEEKARLKAQFIEKLGECRTEMGDKIHAIIVDKAIAVGKIRKLLYCQNLACQVYVALKEREEFAQEMKGIKRKHDKYIKAINEDAVIKDWEIHQEEEKEKHRQEFVKAWHMKVLHVLRALKEFTVFCLKTVPHSADFFINMEKLMLLQIDDALENPSADSMFYYENEEYHAPVPKPMPFYLFCDKGYRTDLDRDLCPKHSGTSEDSQLPAIIINKRCLYAACNNFEQFATQITQYIFGNRGREDIVRDDLVYENFVPAQYTLSDQQIELKLESSIMQVLQQEITDLELDEDETKCICIDISANAQNKMKCLCADMNKSISSTNAQASGSSLIIPSSSSSEAQSQKVSSNKMNRIRFLHETEPTWDSYLEYMKPKTCYCIRSTKKHLVDIPPYMRQSRWIPPNIPDYEVCAFETLKDLVKKAREGTPVVVEELVESNEKNSKDVGTQCTDLEFDNVCACFSGSAVARMFAKLNLTVDPTAFASAWASKGRVVGGDISPSYMNQRTSSFARDRAFSMKNLLAEIPTLSKIKRMTLKSNNMLE